MTTFYTLGRATTKLITSAGALALIAGASLSMAPQAHAYDCLLDTNDDGDADSNVDTDAGADSGASTSRLACGQGASAAGNFSTALGSSASAAGGSSTALGTSAIAAGDSSTALGRDASAGEARSTALGRATIVAGDSSTALGYFAVALGFGSTALGAFSHTNLEGTTSVGYAANNGIAAGANSTALGYYAKTGGTNAIAIGADGDNTILGANAQGNDSIVIGADASDANFDRAIVIGKDALAAEADQIILKSADTFTILGNGDVGLGTATPAGDLDINSGPLDTLLVLSNDTAQWAIKSNAANGKLTIGNNITGVKPFKFGPNAVGNLLQVGISANDQVDIKGDLVLTGTLTTGGPTCGGGCDAVFDADYDLPSIEEHAAQMYANSYLPEIGPTVPRAPVNLSEQYGRVINELEKAHIYIAQMQESHKAEKQAMQVKFDQQNAKLERQNARLERLEALLAR